VLLFWLQTEPESRGQAAAQSDTPQRKAVPAQGFPPAFGDPRPELAMRSDYVELCGVGRVPVQSDGDVYPQHVLIAAQAAIDRFVAAMATGDHPRQRAVGLYVQMGSSAMAAAAEHRSRYPECHSDERCIGQILAVARKAAAPFTVQLARQAMGSQDPRVYALAYYACQKSAGSQQAGGACSQVSPARWAQLEPDNAVPWLALAAATGSGDERMEALTRASKAAASRLHWDAVTELNGHPGVRALDPATRLLFYTYVMGTWAAFPMPSLLAVTQSCGPGVQADQARRQLCSDLAEMLTERSATLLELSIGTSIGERAGWSAERVSALRDRKDAISQIGSEIWAGQDVSSCQFLEKLEVRATELTREGELNAAERQILESGRSVEALAVQWREAQRSRGEATSNVK
jgi:hypothetical protein